MNDSTILKKPETIDAILRATVESGFTMASEPLTGALLRTLAASKPGGKFLELGTGTGLSTAWILNGMDVGAHLTSIDSDAACIDIAQQHLGNDPRLQLVCQDAGDWLSNNSGCRFDFIFADTWHGKYLLLEETMMLLLPGGFYIVDDMHPQPNWPEGHGEKALRFIEELDARPDIVLVKQQWATGIIIVVKK